MHYITNSLTLKNKTMTEVNQTTTNPTTTSQTAIDNLIETIRTSSATSTEKIAILDALTNYIIEKK